MIVCYSGRLEISFNIFCVQSGLLQYTITQDFSANKRENLISVIGLILHYIILRNGIERFRGTEMSFTDTSGVQPYQEYSYQLRACTVAGCTDSSKVSKLVFMELVPEFYQPMW